MSNKQYVFLIAIYARIIANSWCGIWKFLRRVAGGKPWSDGHGDDQECCGTRGPKSHICATFAMKVSSPWALEELPPLFRKWWLLVVHHEPCFNNCGNFGWVREKEREVWFVWKVKGIVYIYKKSLQMKNPFCLVKILNLYGRQEMV